MVAMIRVSCGSCGTVDVPVSESRLQLDLESTDRRNTVVYTCPVCGGHGHQLVGERATRLLGRADIIVVAPAYVEDVPARNSLTRDH